MWKIDELDSSLRQVFEQMKKHIEKQPKIKQHRFTAREIRLQLNLSKSQAARYMEELRKLEYIQVTDGTAQKGYRYKIAYWDDITQTREKIKNELMDQLQRLK